MKYIFNISYVIPAHRKESFLEWAKGEGRRAADSPKMRDYRILTVAAIPGDAEYAKSPDKNLSIQIGFDSLSDCREWNEQKFNALMDSYAKWHGPNPVFFATILKEL